LRSFEQSGDPRGCADTDSQGSGNGSIMRLSPVASAYADWFPDRLEDLIERSIESSVTTHGSAQCLSACAYLGVVLAALIQGRPREEVLSDTWYILDRIHALHPLHNEVHQVARGSYRRKPLEQIRGSGYVVESLEAALWAFHDARDFRQAVLRAVNLGDDTDTTGAVCGQLAGAYWGESGIPTEWRNGLARQDMIEPILERLLR
jgi:ADP-ribosylglycohydrolase